MFLSLALCACVFPDVGDESNGSTGESSSTGGPPSAHSVTGDAPTAGSSGTETSDVTGTTTIDVATSIATDTEDTDSTGAAPGEDTTAGSSSSSSSSSTGADSSDGGPCVPACTEPNQAVVCLGSPTDCAQLACTTMGRIVSWGEYAQCLSDTPCCAGGACDGDLFFAQCVTECSVEQLALMPDFEEGDCGDAEPSLEYCFDICASV